jgi:hypothetical protein
MPLARIDVIKGNPCDYRRAIGYVVERHAMRENAKKVRNESWAGCSTMSDV